MKMIRVLFVLVIIMILSTIILAGYAATKRGNNQIIYTQDKEKYDLVDPDNQYKGLDVLELYK